MLLYGGGVGGSVLAALSTKKKKKCFYIKHILFSFEIKPIFVAKVALPGSGAFVFPIQSKIPPTSPEV